TFEWARATSSLIWDIAGAKYGNSADADVSRHAVVRPLKHVGDGAEPHGLSDRNASEERAIGIAITSRKFCPHASGGARLGEGASTAGTARHRATAVGNSGWRSVSAQAGSGGQREPRLRCRVDGAFDGDHGGLSSAGAASLPAWRNGEPNEDRAIALF